MNILEASKQIEGAVRAYLSQDEHGMWRIPPQMQRPIILMGPPGIGKTAIVAQIADRLDINFVSYSITHHTRQSALGLPYIASSNFGGKEFRVSRYTMSEIIAAVFDAIEDTGESQGILFLDEINCASETLAPAMLQFLQYKTFGQHRLPDGWAIVCAGNPPEYNRAARPFDPAMMDRLKKIDVEPDLDIWLDYARIHGIHPAITSYLEGKPTNFYRVRPSGTDARIVTARGWEDLSRMMQAYSHEDLQVDSELISQYLQDREVAEDFNLYFELFAKYEDDYKVADILSGKLDEKIYTRARDAAFDERVAVVNLLLAAITAELHETDATELALHALREDVISWRTSCTESTEAQPLALLDEILNKLRHRYEDGRSRGSHGQRQLVFLHHLELLEQLREQVARRAMAGADKQSCLDSAKSCFNEAVHTTAAMCNETARRLDRALAFLERAFGDGQEMIVFCSHLACDTTAMHFVSAHGPVSFAIHAKSLMLEERGLELLGEVDAALKTTSPSEQ